MAEELSFAYQSTAQRIVCGRDSIGSLWQEAEALNVRRALVICGPNILNKSDVIGRVKEALRDKYSGIFPEVQPHAPVETIVRGVEVAKGLKPDVLISVGGGSTHDTAKGIAILLAEGGDLRDYTVKVEPPDKVIEPYLPHAKMPIIAVPTTMGGSEFGGGTGFTDKTLGRKLQVPDPKAAPRVIIIDGLALTTTPVPLLLSTGMGQLRICIETVYSRRHNPIGDALALHGMRLLKVFLPRCAEKDLDALLQTKTAAGLPMLSHIGLGLNTAMAHHIGALYGVDHGVANAIPLPYSMRYNLDASAERQVLIAQTLGIDTSKLSPVEAGLAAADEVAALSRSLGLPSRLRDVGVPEDGLVAIAKATMHDRQIPSNPRPITSHQQVLEVLRKAW